MSISSEGDSELSWVEVGSFLCHSIGLKGSLVLGKSASACFGSLISEILGAEFLVLPGVFGSISTFLVDNCQDLGNTLSDNLSIQIKVNINYYTIYKNACPGILWLLSVIRHLILSTLISFKSILEKRVFKHKKSEALCEAKQSG